MSGAPQCGQHLEAANRNLTSSSRVALRTEQAKPLPQKLDGRVQRTRQDIRLE
jgi:hypothetical protein